MNFGRPSLLYETFWSPHASTQFSLGCSAVSPARSEDSKKAPDCNSHAMQVLAAVEASSAKRSKSKPSPTYPDQAQAASQNGLQQPHRNDARQLNPPLTHLAPSSEALQPTPDGHSVADGVPNGYAQPLGIQPSLASAPAPEPASAPAGPAINAGIPTPEPTTASTGRQSYSGTTGARLDSAFSASCEGPKLLIHLGWPCTLRHALTHGRPAPSTFHRSGAEMQMSLQACLLARERDDQRLLAYIFAYVFDHRGPACCDKESSALTWTLHGQVSESSSMVSCCRDIWAACWPTHVSMGVS